MTQELVEESLIEFARTAGMGREQALSCMQDPQNLAEVDENWGEAQNQYNINATPGFVINGTTHSGADADRIVQRYRGPAFIGPQKTGRTGS